MNHKNEYKLGYIQGYEDAAEHKAPAKDFPKLDAYHLGYDQGYHDGERNLEPDYTRGRRREIEREILSFFAV